MNYRVKNGLVALLAALMLLAAAALPAGACVGKTLVIGSTGTVQQDILAQILRTLISERTGTTVKVLHFTSPDALHQALIKADLDIDVEYTGVGEATVLHGPPITDAATLFKKVKANYEQNLNLIWLKPFGFDTPGLAPRGVPDQAAPVVRLDTLKKFPALARLIDKLGGIINNATMANLEHAVKTRPIAKVVRTFLKQHELI